MDQGSWWASQEFPLVLHISPGVADADRSTPPDQEPRKPQPPAAGEEPTSRTMNGLRHDGAGPLRPGCCLSFSSHIIWGLGKKWLRQSLKNPLKKIAIFGKMQLIKLFKFWIVESNTSRALVWLTMGSQVLFLQLISKSHRTILKGDIGCVLMLSKNLICRRGTT